MSNHKLLSIINLLSFIRIILKNIYHDFLLSIASINIFTIIEHRY